MTGGASGPLQRAGTRQQLRGPSASDARYSHYYLCESLQLLMRKWNRIRSDNRDALPNAPIWVFRKSSIIGISCYMQRSPFWCRHRVHQVCGERRPDGGRDADRRDGPRGGVREPHRQRDRHRALRRPPPRPRPRDRRLLRLVGCCALHACPPVDLAFIDRRACTTWRSLDADYAGDAVYSCAQSPVHANITLVVS